MAADDREIHEERVRIICQLPLNNLDQERAILDVFEYLKESKKAGWIHSQFYPLFSGGRGGLKNTMLGFGTRWSFAPWITCSTMPHLPRHRRP
jgi:hypothetical protein